MLLNLAIISLFLAIFLFAFRWAWASLARMNEMRKKQSISVIARWRNKTTENLWADLMDIRLAGILPVGEKVQDFLWAMFPRTMEDLERLRKQNPIAWRETMAYLAPLVIKIKMTAHYSGRDALDGIIREVEGIVGSYTKNDNSSNEDISKTSGNNKNGGRTK